MNDRQLAEIIAHEDRLLETVKTNNVAQLGELLHDDLLFNGPTGETATKAMDLANYASGQIHLHTAAPSDRQVNLIGDNAVVAVTVHLAGTYMEHTLDAKYRYLRIWKQAGASWKVIGGSVVPLV